MTTKRYSFVRLILIPILFIVFSNQFLFAQEFVVRGTVYDEDMNPLYGASVVEEGAPNGTVVNQDGKFTLVLQKTKFKRINISFVGYYTQSYDFTGEPFSSLDDTIYFDVTTQMIIDSTMTWGPHRGYYRVYSFNIGAGASRIKANFSSFSELPGNYISALNEIEYAINLDIGGYYNSIFGLANFSRSANFPATENDSIDESIDMYGFGLKGGYGFSTGRNRLIFTPYIGLDILWYQIVTSDPNETLPLGTYLENQYYHITFRQWTSTIGANIDLKLFGSRKGSPWGYTSMHLRMGAGYIFRLSKYPYIKAPTNVLESDGIIDMNNLYLNAGLVFYLQN